MNANYWNPRTVREVELASIRSFVESQRHLLTGRVLDFGAGKPGTCREPQPYRSLVTGEYCPYDMGDPWPQGQFDAILCTQTLQYIPKPDALFVHFHGWLKPGGKLVATYPTNWTVIEAMDLWRFTPHGMALLCGDAGLRVVKNDLRAQVQLGGFSFELGYGLVASRD